MIFFPCEPTCKNSIIIKSTEAITEAVSFEDAIDLDNDVETIE